MNYKLYKGSKENNRIILKVSDDNDNAVRISCTDIDFWKHVIFIYRNDKYLCSIDISGKDNKELKKKYQEITGKQTKRKKNG